MVVHIVLLLTYYLYKFKNISTVMALCVWKHVRGARALYSGVVWLAGWLAGWLSPPAIPVKICYTSGRGETQVATERGVFVAFFTSFLSQTLNGCKWRQSLKEIYVHFRYDASLLCRRSHQEESESLGAPPFKHLPCGRVLCPTGPKLGSKLILSLSLCVAVSNL